MFACKHAAQGAQPHNILPEQYCVLEHVIIMVCRLQRI